MNRESVHRLIAGTRRSGHHRDHQRIGVPSLLRSEKPFVSYPGIFDTRASFSGHGQSSAYSSLISTWGNPVTGSRSNQIRYNSVFLSNGSGENLSPLSSPFSSSFPGTSTRRYLSTARILTKHDTAIVGRVVTGSSTVSMVKDSNDNVRYRSLSTSSNPSPSSVAPRSPLTSPEHSSVASSSSTVESGTVTDTSNGKSSSPKTKTSRKRSRTPAVTTDSNPSSVPTGTSSTVSVASFPPLSSSPSLSSSTVSNVSIETKLNQLETFFELWSPPIVTQDFQPLLYERILGLSASSSAAASTTNVFDQVLGGRFPLLQKYIHGQIQPLLSVSSPVLPDSSTGGKKKKGTKGAAKSATPSAASARTPPLPTILIQHLQSSAYLRSEFKQLVDVLIDLRLQFLLCLSKDILPDRLLPLSKTVNMKGILSSLGTTSSSSTSTKDSTVSNDNKGKRKLSTDTVQFLTSLHTLVSSNPSTLSSSVAAPTSSNDTTLPSSTYYYAIHALLKKNLRIEDGAYQIIETEAYVMALSIFTLRLRRILAQTIHTNEIEQLYKQGYDTAGDYIHMDKIPLVAGLRNLVPDTVLEFSNNVRSIFEHTVVASTSTSLLAPALPSTNTGTRAWKALETSIVGQQLSIIEARDRLITQFSTVQSPSIIQIAQLLAIFVGDKQLISAIEQLKVRIMARAAVNIGNGLLTKFEKMDKNNKSDMVIELKELNKLGTKLGTSTASSSLSSTGKRRSKSLTTGTGTDTSLPSSSPFSLPYYSRQSWQHILNESINVGLSTVTTDAVNKTKIQQEVQSLLNTVNIRTTLDNALPEKSRGAKQEVRDAALHGSIVTKYERIMHHILVTLHQGNERKGLSDTNGNTVTLQPLRKEDQYTIYALPSVVQSLQHTVVPQLFGQDKFAYTGFWRVLESGPTAITTPEQAKQLLEVAEMVTLITEGYESSDVLQRKKEIRIANTVLKQKSKGKYKTFPAGTVSGASKQSIPSPLIDPGYEPLSAALLQHVANRDTPNAYYLILGGIHFLRPGDVRRRFNSLLGNDVTTILGVSSTTDSATTIGTAIEAVPVSPWKKLSEESKSVLSQLSTGTSSSSSSISPTKSAAPTEQELLDQLRSHLQTVFNLHPLPAPLRRFDNLSSDCRGLLLSFAIRLCLVVPDSTLLDIRKALDKAMHELHSAGNFRPAHYTPYTSTLSSHSGSAASQKQIAAGARMEIAKTVVPSPGSILPPMSLIFRSLGPVAFLYMPAITYLVTHAWLTPHVLDLARAIVIHAFTRPAKENDETTVVDQLLQGHPTVNNPDTDASMFTKVIQELRNTRQPHVKLREDSRPSDVMVVTQKLRELIHAKGDEIGLPEHRRKLWENIKSEKLKSLAYLIGEQANKIDALATVQKQTEHHNNSGNTNGSDNTTNGTGGHPDDSTSLVLDRLLKDPLPGIVNETSNMATVPNTADVSSNETGSLQSSFLPATTGSMYFTATRIVPHKTEGKQTWEIYNTPDAIRRKVAIFRLPIMGLSMKNEVVAQLQREIAIAEGGVRGKLLLRQNLKQAGKDEEEIQSALKDIKTDQPTPARATLLLGERMSDERLMESIKHLGEIQKIDLQWEWAKAYEEEIWGSLHPSFKKWASRQNKTKKKDDSSSTDSDTLKRSGAEDQGITDSIDEEAAYTNIYGHSASSMDAAIMEEEIYDDDVVFSDADETEELYDESMEASFASSTKNKPSVVSSSPVLTLSNEGGGTKAPFVRHFSTLTVRINRDGSSRTLLPSFYLVSPLSLYNTLHTFSESSLQRYVSTDTTVTDTPIVPSSTGKKGKKKTKTTKETNPANDNENSVIATDGTAPSPVSNALAPHYSPRSYANQLSSTNNLQPIVAMRYGRKKDGELLKRYIRNFNIRSELHGFVYFHDPVAAQRACSSTLRHFGVVIDSTSSCRLRPATELRSLLLRRIPPGLTQDSVLIILRYILQSIGLNVHIATVPRYNYVTDGSTLTSIHRPLTNIASGGSSSSSPSSSTATMMNTKHRILIDFTTHEDAVQAYHALQNIQLADWGLARGQSLVVGWPTPEQVVSIQNASSTMKK